MAIADANPRPSRSSASRRDAARAFTIFELVIVLGIIAVLVGITVGIAQRVNETGRQRATEAILRTLDTITDEYFQATDGQLQNVAVFTVVENGNAQDSYLIPIIDGVPLNGGNPMRVSGSGEPVIQASGAAFLAAAAQRSDAADRAIKSIDGEFLRRGIASNVNDRAALFGWELDNNGAITGNLQVVDAEIPVPVDAWGNPLRFVHPDFQGGAGVTYAAGAAFNRDLIEFPAGSPEAANFRRSAAPVAARTVGDADEGICIGSRPYWYSAGPDGDPGTIEDNVYSNRPQFDQTSAARNN